MSLDWDARNVAGFDESHGFKSAEGLSIEESKRTKAQQIEWAKTELIIFASMLTGLDAKKWEITKEGAPELFARLHVLESTGVISPVKWHKHGETTEHRITYADVVARIGLRTSVAPVTRNQFFIKVGQSLMDKARHDMPDDVRATFKAWSR